MTSSSCAYKAVNEKEQLEKGLKEEEEEEEK
jgi:hypothetical protein